jgi:hypothetical protein
MALLVLGLLSVWLPVRPLVEDVARNLAAGDPQALLASLTSTALIPLLAAALLLFLIALESRFNPVLLVRDAVYDMFAIPRKAHEVYNVLRTSRLAGVDAEVRKESLDRLLVPSLDLGDFDKASDTVEYKWAQTACCSGRSSPTRISPPSVASSRSRRSKWGQICLSFNEASEKVAIWRSAEPHYTKTLSLMQQLDHLTGLLCRLLACLVVFGSPKRARDVGDGRASGRRSAPGAAQAYLQVPAHVQRRDRARDRHRTRAGGVPLQTPSSSRTRRSRTSASIPSAGCSTR